MDRRESEWLYIIEQDVGFLERNRSSHKNSLTVMLAGLASLGWSILAVIDGGSLSRHDVPFVAPYFLSTLWFSGAVIALAMIYHRKWLLPIEEAVRADAAHGLVDASDILSAATDAVAVAASVFTVFLIWDSDLGLALSVFYSAVVVWIGFGCGARMMIIFSRKDLLRIFLDYFEFPKRRVNEPKTQRPTPRMWTFKNIRVSTGGFLLGSLVMLAAWQLAPDIDYLLLGMLIFIALYLAKSSFEQYGHIVDSNSAIDAFLMLRQRIIISRPAMVEIERSYKALWGIKDKENTSVVSY